MTEEEIKAEYLWATGPDLNRELVAHAIRVARLFCLYRDTIYNYSCDTYSEPHMREILETGDRVDAAEIELQLARAQVTVVTKLPPLCNKDQVLGNLLQRLRNPKYARAHGAYRAKISELVNS